MATYSDHAQRELDASDIAAEVVPFKPTRRLPSVTVPQETELDDEIRDAMYDALSDADGHTSPYYLRHHLAKHGLIIVEASKWGSAKAALMVIGSCGAPLGGNSIGTALDAAAEVTRAALKKMVA